MRKKLADPEYYDYALLAYMLRDFPEVTEVGLSEFANILAYEQYGCSKSDVQGLLSYLDKYGSKLKRSKENVSNRNQNTGD